MEQYYGVEGPIVARAPGQTGAGHDSDNGIDDNSGGEEHVDEVNDIGGYLDATNAAEFNHEAVDVPEGISPFATLEAENDFHDALAIAREENIVPYGYGLHPEELDGDDYPTLEIIRSSRRGRREIEVGLPDHIWRPRGLLWIQGLDILTRLLEDV